MKKSISLLFFIFSIFSALAQVQVAEYEIASTRFIPGMFMKDGKAALYFSDDEYGYGYNVTEASIYDFDFNLVKSFPFSKGGTYQIVESKQQTGTTSKETNYFSCRGIVPNSFHGIDDMQNRTVDFAEFILNQTLPYEPNHTVGEYMADFVRNDTLFVVSETIPQYNYTYERGLYLAPNNNWGNYDRNFIDNLPIYNGDWNTSKVEADDRNLVIPICYDVDRLNDWLGGLYLPFSQTFFNNDEKFEYVRYIYDIAEGGHSSNGGEYIYEGYNPFGITSTDWDGDGVVDHRSTFYGMHYKGIEVVDENNKVLYTFESPIGFCDEIKVRFYRSQNSILAEIDYLRGDNGPCKCIFYRIDCESGSIQKMKETTSLKAYPNPTNHGEPIFIELPYSDKDRIIEVSSSSGQIIQRANIKGGEQRAMIRTNNMYSGLYIVSMIENGQVINTAKLIVK